jgi:Ca-activated chloride channel family protein
MLQDLKPIEWKLLKVASDFADERPNDRIGLVVYASEAYTKHRKIKEWVLEAIKSIKRCFTGWTGIGMGLATAVNRLKDSKAKAKVIILLTDKIMQVSLNQRPRQICTIWYKSIYHRY